MRRRGGGSCGKAERGFRKGGGGASVRARLESRGGLLHRRAAPLGAGLVTAGGGASAWGASKPSITAPSPCRRRGLCASPRGLHLPAASPPPYSLHLGGVGGPLVPILICSELLAGFPAFCGPSPTSAEAAIPRAPFREGWSTGSRSSASF